MVFATRGVKNFAFVKPENRRTKVANHKYVKLAWRDGPLVIKPLEWKPRLSSHFCPSCGSRFFGFRCNESAYEQGWCWVCGTFAYMEDVVKMKVIPLPDK